MSWKDKIAEYRNNQAQGASLNVLLFGPGVDNRDFEKRKKLKEELSLVFSNKIEIRMSEDPELRELTGGRVRNEADEEDLQAIVADLIIALDISEGVGEEISRYASKNKIAYKMFVLTSKKYSESKSIKKVYRERLHCYYFSDEEFESCSLTDVCKERIEIEIDRNYLNS